MRSQRTSGIKDALDLIRGWGKKEEPSGMVESVVATGPGAQAIQNTGSLITGDVNVNVLAAEAADAFLGRWGGAAAADLRQATEQYLQTLANRYQFLEFKGMGVVDRVPLRLPLLQMYVPLKARIELPEGDTWARGLRLAGRAVSEEEAEAMGRRISEPQPVLALLQQHPGLIILGDPGAGKTTFLKYLALRLALGQDVGVGERLPVLLPLSAYANRLAQRDVALADFIAEYYQGLVGRELPLGRLLQAALDKGQALLLLDGLDEVKDAGQRRRVVERVVQFFSFWQQRGNKFVLTSRIVGYREVRPAATGVMECTLLDFDEEEMAAFVDKWTAALEQAAQASPQLAAQAAAREKTELLAAIHNNPGVRRLAANPLLLTILALMKRQGVTLPERRVALYEQYVQTLLQHWNLARGLDGSAGPRPEMGQTLKALAPLALWMHETSPGVGLVKEQALRRQLALICRERGWPEPEETARRFLQDARDHAGLLVERGQGTFGFIHLTFQEYLAAAAVAQKGQNDPQPVVDALAARLDDDNWHEVARLAVGYLGIVQQRDEAASAVVQRLVAQRAGQPGQAEIVAGEAVADIWPGGVTPGCRAEIQQALRRAMQDDGRVPPPPRARVGATLARMGDPRPGVVPQTVDDLAQMPFCFVPKGTFWLGEQPAAEMDLPYDYWLARYPVTVGQYRLFLQQSSHSFQGYHDYLVNDPLNSPARGLTWHDALAFCRWLDELWRDKLPTGCRITLPSEVEWEKAARGGLLVPVPGATHVRTILDADFQPAAGGLALVENPLPQRRYPWGDEFDANKANTKESGIGGPSAVGAFPGGETPYGCLEMSGNVWEWTRSHWQAYPYQLDGKREDLRADNNVPRVLRGGAYGWEASAARCPLRLWLVPDGEFGHSGFRLALSPFDSGRW